MKTPIRSGTALQRATRCLAGALLLAGLLPWTAGAISLLDCWTFSDTNWLSWRGNAPLSFTNVINVQDAGDANALLLDTTNTTPAFLIYNLAGSDGTNEISLTNGTISLWFNPDWSSADQTNGTGPGDWANFLALGDVNGSNFWGFYLDAAGTNISFSASSTADGSQVTYFSAPVSLTAGVWCNLVLTYCATNSALYLNGQLLTNGTGVSFWPGPGVTFFSVGSATNGFFQARGMLDDLHTYDYPRDAETIRILYGMMSGAFYGYAEANIVSAPSSPTNTPTFNAITGPGYLQTLTNATPCVTSSNVWITNAVATVTSNGTVNLVFTIAGGTNGSNVLYDVFANASLDRSSTNYQWAWMGQGPSCTTYLLTNLPNQSAYLILGTPLDSDSDGLTDAYERLISHTNPYVADTSGDGMLDGWKVLWGLNPLIDNTAQSGQRANFAYDPADPAGWLKTLSGTRAETITLDAEGNVKTSQ